MNRKTFVEAQRAVVNFACDAVENAQSQFPCLPDENLLYLLVIGIKHSLAGGVRDVV